MRSIDTDAIKPETKCSEIPNKSDTIYRQAAIDAVLDRMDAEKHGRNAKPEEIQWALERLPSAQPEPSIPLSWIDEQIERLKGLDNAFATLTAMQISGMVKKWRDEQDG